MSTFFIGTFKFNANTFTNAQELKCVYGCVGVFFLENPALEEWLHGPVKVFSVSVNLRQFE